MKKELIQTLIKDFEDCVKHTETGLEFWLARDLQHLLGYTEWRNFFQAIQKAQLSCKSLKIQVKNHFVDVNKMVSIGSDSQREVQDFMLTRHACYLIAQNGDPRKEKIRKS